MHDLSRSAPPHRIVRLADDKSGLDGVIVLHSTRLGPAAGGCRMWRYPATKEAIADAVRLAEGMTYKNALAGLPFGGGKAVLRRPAEGFDRAALFAAFGRHVAALDGQYVTAEDVGTGVADMAHVATQTRHVAGLDVPDGKAGGDPSPFTARGVFRAMSLSAERRLGRPLCNVTVAVQGLGNVGFALCRLLHEAGARLIVAEPRAEVAARAAMLFEADVASVAAIAEAKADIFAPCALGAALNDKTVPKLRARIVCGAANNQLADCRHGEMLADRGILYAPDYVVNAGGIISVATEYLGWPAAEVALRIDGIADRLAAVFERAEERKVATNAAADEIAREIIAAGPAAPFEAAAA